MVQSHTESLQSSVSSRAGQMWGAGNYLTTRDPIRNGVDAVVRVAAKQKPRLIKWTGLIKAGDSPQATRVSNEIGSNLIFSSFIVSSFSYYYSYMTPVPLLVDAPRLPSASFNCFLLWSHSTRQSFVESALSSPPTLHYYIYLPPVVLVFIPLVYSKPSRINLQKKNPSGLF